MDPIICKEWLRYKKCILKYVNHKLQVYARVCDENEEKENKEKNDCTKFFKPGVSWP